MKFRLDRGGLGTLLGGIREKLRVVSPNRFGTSLYPAKPQNL